MEASEQQPGTPQQQPGAPQQPGTQQQPGAEQQRGAPAGTAATAAAPSQVPPGQPAEQTVVPEGTPSQEAVGEQQVPPAEVGGGGSIPPGGEVAGMDADRTPATEQSTVASAAQEAITGDPGFGDQSPAVAEGGTQSANTPMGTSMQPPEMQSGMPLPEDRAAAAAEREGSRSKQEKQEEKQEERAEGQQAS